MFTTAQCFKYRAFLAAGDGRTLGRVMSPQIDHLCWLVDDPEATASALRALGVGCEQGMYYPPAGTQHWNIPLQPPQIVEFMTIVDREAAATGTAGPETLAAEAAGGGLFAWAVLVDDLDERAATHGLIVDDYTLPQPDGTLRGWRTASGPPHLPFFIDYPNNGDRAGRLQAMYKRVGHTSSPTHVEQIIVEGDQAELRDWIGPHDLPIDFVRGSRGIVAADISTRLGALRFPALTLVTPSHVGPDGTSSAPRLRAEQVATKYRGLARPTC